MFGGVQLTLLSQSTQPPSDELQRQDVLHSVAYRLCITAIDNPESCLIKVLPSISQHFNMPAPERAHVRNSVLAKQPHVFTPCGVAGFIWSLFEGPHTAHAWYCVTSVTSLTFEALMISWGWTGATHFAEEIGFRSCCRKHQGRM